MSDRPEERRRFQRLDLAEPLPARFDDTDVELLDVGVVGALLRHTAVFEPDRRGILQFRWQGVELRFEARVVHSERGTGDAAHLYFSGTEVTAALGDSDQRLRLMIAEHVSRVVSAQEANAFGDRERNWIDADHTLTALGSARRAMATGFVTWRLQGDGWKKSAALLPDQPRDGFTVAAWEEEEQIDRLRRAFEEADEEGRTFLRMLAELSISEARGIPPRK